MRSIYLLVTLCFVLVNGKIHIDESYPTNSSNDIYPIVTSVLNDIPICRGLPICHYVERLRGERKIRESVVDSNPALRSKGETGLVEARSYYGGYGSSPMAPALYPAIDTVSVLASLAFLAFLLHSFASLFDRSRSIIPSVVSSRQAPGERGLPDPVKLVLRALDEYDILSNNEVTEDPKNGGKTTWH